MKRIFITLTICLYAMFIYGQQINQEKAISEISTAAATIKSMKCDFIQTKSLKILGDKMVSKGNMQLKQPDLLKWQYTTPYSYTFTLDGNKVSIEKGGRKDVIDINESRMFKEITRIMMNTLLGKCLTDRKSFKTTVMQKDQMYLATLVPLKKDIKQMFTKIVLHYNRQIAKVTKVELHEKNGDSTLIELLIKN
ncbi:MAG: outer membrane lipoprotein carrier protein LolA [Bacteroidaceae bacterium]|nr:outer membrane lipoprotein carrier protein LolA [Bacteroidaceae bacterium]